MVEKQKILDTFLDSFHHTGNVTVDDDGLVSVSGEVVMMREQDSFPVYFDRVGDRLVCAKIGLKTLIGGPKSVKKSVMLQGNMLTSLHGFPQILLGGEVRLDDNLLSNLKGLPSKISGTLVAIYNPLDSLEGFPEDVDEVFLPYGANLPLLRALTARKIVLWGTTTSAVEQIMNQYAGEGKRGAIRCQKALIAAGFEGNAKW
jgi:hypothetical protein